jgi:hypothetical protein
MYQSGRVELYHRVLCEVWVHGVVEESSGEVFISYAELRHVLGAHCQVNRLLQALVVREMVSAGLLEWGGKSLLFVVAWVV